MNIYSVTFAGHREVLDFNEIEEKLDLTIENLLRTKEFVDFYVGNDGEFDIMATSAIRRLRKEMGGENSTLNLVLPYPKANMDLLEMSFDSVFVPSEITRCPPRAAIPARNKWLVDNCDLLICYVRNKGGAMKTKEYAEKRGKETLYL